ncbi:hypothetical protein GALMADRAFT_253537 [Galerina marginata CBS 339.88]|uniref:CBM1 domain-containing protein n=1 Tax=Galerina marginata (strain CBS 339.88) TaxID=685588 RepID=A0A067SP23_GALM3|nr:hypothetical protein GALMADRAFT_253537 [Galerina marginata CBS 339.88]
MVSFKLTTFLAICFAATVLASPANIINVAARQDDPGSGSMTTPSPTTSLPATTTSSSAVPPTSSIARHYDLCGGEGWTGATVCATPYTCVVLNRFWSQCL